MNFLKIYQQIIFEGLEEYSIDDNFYLYKNGKRYYSSDSKGDLIAFLKENNPDLIKYLGLDDKTKPININNLPIKLESKKLYSQSELANLFPSFNYHLRQGFIANVPVDKIEGLDPEPGTWSDDEGVEYEYEPKKLPEDKPIEVKMDYLAGNLRDLDSYQLILFDGNHRVKQAKINKDQYIKAIVEPMDQKSYNFLKN